MLRVCVIRRGKYFNRDYSRVAHRNPWYENVAAITAAVVGVCATSFAFYVGRRVYYAYMNPRIDPVTINLRMDEIVFENIDYPAVVIRMALHHVLAQTETPFGSPMVAPEYLRPYAEEIGKRVVQLQQQYPAISVPDLWALLFRKSLAVMGGPDIKELWGRGEAERFEDHVGLLKGKAPVEREWLRFTEPKYKDHERDVWKLKKIIVSQGFTTSDLLAIVAMRNVGFHEEEFALRSRAMFRQQLKQPTLPQTGVTDEMHQQRIRETRFKCGMDPYLYDNDYLTTLVDFEWERRFLPHRKSVPGAADQSFAAQSVLWICRVCNLLSTEERDAFERSWRYTTTAHPYDRYVALQGIDLALRDDPSLRGFLMRYSENEAKFFGASSRTLLKLTKLGHEDASLREQILDGK